MEPDPGTARRRAGVEIERVSRLKRFLPPQVAELILSSGNGVLESHRREVTIVFCDLRGFTAFAESCGARGSDGRAARLPCVLGDHITRHEGTLERFSGDGILVVFNESDPGEDHTERAVRMSLEVRQVLGGLAERWQRQGHDLGFGIGIARLRHTGPDRVRPAPGLFGDRHRDQPGLAPLRRGEGRADSGEPARRDRRHAARRDRTFLGDQALKGFARPVPVYEIGACKAPSEASARRLHRHDAFRASTCNISAVDSQTLLPDRAPPIR